VNIIETAGSNKIGEVAIINCVVSIKHKINTTPLFLQIQNNRLYFLKKLATRIDGLSSRFSKELQVQMHDRGIDMTIVRGTSTISYDLQGCHAPYTKYLVLVSFTKLRQYGLTYTSPSASTGYHSYYKRLSICRTQVLVLCK
jgi:hypothetical protein